MLLRSRGRKGLTSRLDQSETVDDFDGNEAVGVNFGVKWAEKEHTDLFLSKKARGCIFKNS